jgi:hypothetical protein
MKVLGKYSKDLVDFKLSEINNLKKKKIDKQFHLHLRTDSHCLVLERLDLKESIQSLTLDFCNYDQEDSELSINVITREFSKVRTLIIGGAFASLSRMEDILLLQ